MLLRLPLDESSAKVRTGFPLDEAEDYDLEIWAGVIPFATVVEPARVDPDLRVAVAMPPYVERYRRPVAVAPGDLEALAPTARRSRPRPRRSPRRNGRANASCAASSGSCSVTRVSSRGSAPCSCPWSRRSTSAVRTPRASPSMPTARAAPVASRRLDGSRRRAPAARLPRLRRRGRLDGGRVLPPRCVCRRRRAPTLRRRRRARCSRTLPRRRAGGAGGGVAPGADPRHRRERARPQGHRSAERHLRALRRTGLGGLPRRGPHPYGHGVHGHRPAFAPVRPGP